MTLPAVLVADDATLDDVSALVRLVNAAYRDPGPAPGWTDERGLVSGTRTDPDTLRAELSASRFLVLRFQSGAPPVACLRVQPHPPDAWLLSTIAVDPARQAAGLGRQLLAGTEHLARAAGICRLALTVIPLRTDLVGWYERRGFRSTGAVLPFPYGDPAVGTPLRPDLTLAVMEKRLVP
ncbi:MAG: GNAT family N-acetyltransferase [Gluconacetobacter diazotrophicus]|nr:GNAT family N-acetyltransferase [Gluconacetobacter diazotrophicus]